MSTTVTQESISALTNMGTQLEQLAAKIHQETGKLRSAYEENKDGLGPHSESILKLLEEVEGAESAASIPVKKLVLKLTRAAVIRQDILNKNRYTSSQTKGRSR